MKKLETMTDWDGRNIIYRPPNLKEIASKINEIIDALTLHGLLESSTPVPEKDSVDPT